MKTLVNIETGKLNEFGNFYQDVDFQNQGSQEVYDLIENELSDEIEEIKNSPEFWCAEFVNPFDNETYVIAADGETTSSGMYVVAKITHKTQLKIKSRKEYKVTYSGNATRFSKFEDIVWADSEREAVEDVYCRYLNSNYFPQEDGSIKDCDGNTIAEATDNIIEYDGGCFSAEEIEEEF